MEVGLTTQPQIANKKGTLRGAFFVVSPEFGNVHQIRGPRIRLKLLPSKQRQTTPFLAQDLPPVTNKNTDGGPMSNLLNEKEVSELIGMSVHWLRRKRWSGGGIPFCKLGERGAVRYRPEDVEAFIVNKVRKSTSDQGQ